MSLFSGCLNVWPDPFDLVVENLPLEVVEVDLKPLAVRLGKMAINC